MIEVIKAGGVTFESLPIGALFFFPGEYIWSNRKEDVGRYSRPYYDWSLRIDPDTLVFLDRSNYVA